MKKILLGIVAVFAVVILGFLAVVAMQPAEIHVERSTTIEATPAHVFAHVSDLRRFVEWSPWSDVDPNQTTDFSDPPSGVGAWYSWEGNKEVGVGKMTITEVVADKKVVQELAFFEPWESKGYVSFLLEPAGEGTQVTWTFDENAGFMMKAMGLFMSMDEMLGSDYEKGLASLKATVEAQAAEQRAAEEAVRAAEEATQPADGNEDAGTPPGAPPAG